METSSLTGLCLICSQLCNPQATGHFMSGNREDLCDELIAQVNIHFVIRKLLQISESSCETLMVSHGSLAKWGTSFCLQCSCLIEEAKDISQQMSRLFSKFQSLQQKLQDKVLESIHECRPVTPGFQAEVQSLCEQRLNNLPRTVKTKITEETEVPMDLPLIMTETERIVEPSNQEMNYPNPTCLSTADFSYGTIKNSPVSIHDDLMDNIPDAFLQPDDDYLDPKSVLQVVSDIGNEEENYLDTNTNIRTGIKRRNSEELEEGDNIDSYTSRGCDVSKRGEYFRKIMELHSSQAKNTVLIPKDKYRRIAVELKQFRDTGKRSKFISNYYKRYELLEFMGTLALVRSGTQKRVVAAEDLFDVINAAHTATNHGGRDSILKHLKEDFFNVTKHQVNTFLALCDGCVGKRVRKR